MKNRVRELIEQGDKLFSAKSSLQSLWQTTAENFYPERADFTVTRSWGLEFAAHLMTGAPAMCRRDLANQIGAMLRPRGQPWFHPRTPIERINKDPSARKWLDWAGEVQRRAMYDSKSGFVRATREGDHDFATFGQTVIQPQLNQTRDALLYRCWHLRDCAWAENGHLEIDRLHRKWKIDARQLMGLFGQANSGKVKDVVGKEPFKNFACQHIVLPADDYDLKQARGKKLPFVSIYIDKDNETILEERPAFSLGYVVPRWQTVSGSPYAYSPATVIAIADARMLQQITLTLLEAGQKAVDPPMLAVGEVIQGGVNTFAGGVTYIDAEYDEKTGEALRPLPIDRSGLNWGVDRETRILELIKEAFYLNQINLPDIGKDMTAYETQKRVEEYIRRALPLFEPMETEYNGALCDETFDILLRNGAFGNMQDMPDILRGQDVRFTFESPLQAAQSRANSQAFQQTAQLLQIAVQMDPSVRHDVDVDRAFRDAVEGAGAPANWMVDEKVAAQRKADDARQQAAAMQQQQTMDELERGAGIADQAGSAAQKIGAAMGMQPQQAAAG